MKWMSLIFSGKLEVWRGHKYLDLMIQKYVMTVSLIIFSVFMTRVFHSEKSMKKDPWLSRGLLKSVKRKHNLHKQYLT